MSLTAYATKKVLLLQKFPTEMYLEIVLGTSWQIIGMKQFNYNADSVKDLLTKLFSEYGEILQQELMDENWNLKKHYRIVVNGRNINLLNGFATKLTDEDMIVIMPAIAGG